MALGGKRYVRGDRAFRKLLKRLPGSIKEEMAGKLDRVGSQLLAAMQADVPRRTGALAAGLSKRLLRGSLRLRVGIVGRPTNRRLFYRWIVERGRRAQTVTVVRGTAKSRAFSARMKRQRGETLRKPYKLRVRAMKARPFVHSPRTELRTAFNREIGSYWNDVLARASTGDISDD